MSDDASEFWILKIAVNKQKITAIAFLAENSLSLIEFSKITMKIVFLLSEFIIKKADFLFNRLLISGEMICNHNVAFPCYWFDRSRSKSMNQFFFLNINYELWSGGYTKWHNSARSRWEPFFVPHQDIEVQWLNLFTTVSGVYLNNALHKLELVFRTWFHFLRFLYRFSISFERLFMIEIRLTVVKLTPFALMIFLPYWSSLCFDHNLWMDYNGPRFMGPRKFGQMIQTRLDILMSRKFMPKAMLQVK